MVCFESRKFCKRAETLASTLKWVWVLQSLERAYSQLSLAAGLNNSQKTSLCYNPC